MRLMWFGNRLLRKACGPKKKQVKRDWRKLDEEEPYVSYSSSGDQIKGNEVGGECDMRRSREMHSVYYTPSLRCGKMIYVYTYI
jgi:hypothetical protein